MSSKIKSVNLFLLTSFLCFCQFLFSVEISTFKITVNDVLVRSSAQIREVIFLDKNIIIIDIQNASVTSLGKTFSPTGYENINDMDANTV